MEIDKNMNEIYLYNKLNKGCLGCDLCSIKLKNKDKLLNHIKSDNHLIKAINHISKKFKGNIKTKNSIIRQLSKNRKRNNF